MKMMKPIKQNQKEIIDPELLKEIIEKFGKRPQLLMICEECNELSFAILKYIRHEHFEKIEDIDLVRIADEIADVYIMLSQVKQILNLNHLVNDKIDLKLNRLIERLHEHENTSKT